MKVRYLGESDPFQLLHGKIYEVTYIDEDTGWYSVVDETDDDYMYAPEDFEIVEEGFNGSK